MWIKPAQVEAVFGQSLGCLDYCRDSHPDTNGDAVDVYETRQNHERGAVMISMTGRKEVTTFLPTHPKSEVARLWHLSGFLGVRSTFAPGPRGCRAFSNLS